MFNGEIHDFFFDIFNSYVDITRGYRHWKTAITPQAVAIHFTNYVNVKGNVAFDIIGHMCASCKMRSGKNMGRFTLAFRKILQMGGVYSCLVVTGTMEFYDFPFNSVGNVIIPTDELHHFSEG